MPYGGQRYVSKYLTNYATKYSNNEYIADKVFTTDIPVMQETGRIPVFNYERRLEHTLRPNGAPANMATWGMSFTSYVVSEHAIKDILTDRDLKNSDPAVQVELATVENLKDIIMIRQEQEAADLFFGSNWSNVVTNTSATSWRSNTTTSNMIGNVLSATGLILRWSGKTPNTMILGWQVYESARENPQNYARIMYTDRALITPEIMASMLDIDRLFVGKASRNTGDEGLAATTTFMWGNLAWLGYMDPSPGLRKVSAAVRLRVDGTSTPYKVKKWRDEELSGDYIEVSTMSNPIAVATLAAFLWSAAAV